MIDSRKQLVIDAIKFFDKKANELISLLAEEYDLDLSQKHPFGKLLSIQNGLRKGNMKNNWRYKFHGDACEFTNTETNQFLDVKINRNGNYGTIDNYYLFRFIETTDSLKYVYEKISSVDILYEVIADLEKDNIIINIAEFPFRTRILNSQILNSSKILRL